MREILFRGKRVDNGEWVEDIYLDQNHLGVFCYDAECQDYDITVYIVLPETVGQYTGLTDKSGTKIFEGDILRDDDNEENGFVEFINGEFCVVFGNVETHGIYDIACCCYVIGNIHDNPELLKGGEENG